MLLVFPNLDSLTLALQTGLLPGSLALAPAQAWQTAEGRLLITTAATMDRAALADLKPWGITGRARAPKPPADARTVSCLAEVLPLVRDRAALQIPERQSVIFWLASDAPLPGLVQEILRQNNDRIALRSLDVAGQRQHLVRVIGPPYYTLLQAIEAAREAPIKAYVERAPRVWIEIGYTHPLTNALQPAPGEWLFLSAPSTWQGVAEAPFRDLYGNLDLKLPQQPIAGIEAPTPRLKVPLRMTRSSVYETPELWILRERALEQLEQFVHSATDQTLARLAFAVIDGESPCVLVRVRPGKGPPPELVFDGLPCRAYLRIPNLYVPIDQRLQPPLRRDALKQLLAADATQVVWLEGSDGGKFTPRVLPESAFRPLPEWVEYVLARDHETLHAWVHSSTFEFDRFVCRDDLPPTSEKAERTPTTNKPATAAALPEAAPATAPPAKATRRALPPPSKSLEAAEPSELERRLSAAEQQFVALKTPLDDPARTPLWQELAMLNAVLNRHQEAGQCFTHTLWESDSGEHWGAVEEWLTTETKACSLPWASALREIDSPRARGALERLVQLEAPMGQHGHLLAALLVSTLQLKPQRMSATQFAAVQHFLEKVEPLMSVRAVWLSWHALYQRSGDELTLARARDRILHRLHQHGLQADLEVPIFLRGGGGNSDRYRTIRQELLQLQQVVRVWSERNRGLASNHTQDYLDLLFAFALARLGESSLAQELVQSAGKKLKRNDPVHDWLFEAFAYRIRQLLEGTPPTGQFPEHLLRKLEQLERLDRYKADRLRQHSSILEPHESLDPYREWGYRAGSLKHELAMLADMHDRGDLERQLQSLLERQGTATENAKVLAAALEVSWRVGEEFTLRLLKRTSAALNKDVSGADQVHLLEKAVLAAGHFDLRDQVTVLLQQLRNWISPEATADKDLFNALERALNKAFQGLRKLGMRDEIERLLADASQGLRAAPLNVDSAPQQMRMLLVLAAAGLSLGLDTGWQDIDRVREKLLSEDHAHEGHLGARAQTLLGVSYLQAVGQAPLKVAMERFREFFEHTTGVRDNTTVNSHYSLKQLDVVEALVQMMTSDTFTMDRSARTWLDDEEYLIRRRIHHDVRQALEHKP